MVKILKGIVSDPIPKGFQLTNLGDCTVSIEFNYSNGTSVTDSYDITVAKEFDLEVTSPAGWTDVPGTETIVLYYSNGTNEQETITMKEEGSVKVTWSSTETTESRITASAQTESRTSAEWGGSVDVKSIATASASNSLSTALIAKVENEYKNIHSTTLYGEESIKGSQGQSIVIPEMTIKRITKWVQMKKAMTTITYYEDESPRDGFPDNGDTPEVFQDVALWSGNPGYRHDATSTPIEP